jgi:DNA-binding MarR family transcriptional regulator
MRNILRIEMDDDLLPTASEAFGRVFVIVGHLTRLADDGLVAWGLTTRQWLLLAVLTRGFPGHAPTLSEAAEAYGSSRQNVKQIALGLEARGFLRLVPDARDGRATRLEITDRVGIFDEPDGVARGRAVIEAAFAGLERDEVIALHDLVGRWLAGLSTTPTATTRPGKAGTR